MDNQIKEDELGRPRSIQYLVKKLLRFGGKTWSKGRYSLEDGADGRTILKWIVKNTMLVPVAVRS